MNYGPSPENIVYLYLVSNGYQVSVGRIGKFECDFIVRKANGDYACIQVIYSISGNPRYIISLDRLRDHQEGVHHINAADLFKGKRSNLS